VAFRYRRGEVEAREVKESKYKKGVGCVKKSIPLTRNPLCTCVVFLLSYRFTTPSPSELRACLSCAYREYLRSYRCCQRRIPLLEEREVTIRSSIQRQAIPLRPLPTHAPGQEKVVTCINNRESSNSCPWHRRQVRRNRKRCWVSTPGEPLKKEKEILCLRSQQQHK